MSLMTLNRMFYETQARLFNGGKAAFLVAEAAAADQQMAEAGGIKPFSYECQHEGWSMFKLTVSEVGRALRTDAQRSLVRARSRQRKPGARPSSQRRGRSAQACRPPAASPSRSRPSPP